MPRGDPQGWIKLWRQIDESEISNLPHSHFRIWLWILTNATHKAMSIGGINLQPGELLTTAGRIAMQLSWQENRQQHQLSRQQIRSALRNLVKLRMLEMQPEPQPGCIRLKVLHWEEYQGTQDRTVTRTATELQPDSNHITRREEGKKVRKSMAQESSPACCPTHVGYLVARHVKEGLTPPDTQLKARFGKAFKEASDAGADAENIRRAIDRCVKEGKGPYLFSAILGDVERASVRTERIDSEIPRFTSTDRHLIT